MRLILPLVMLFLSATATLAEDVPRAWERAWPQTDFSRSAVPFDQIFSGGPPKDGIPALDAPQFSPAADSALPQDEPVITVALPGAAARAYPLRYLMWHEIVNDRVAGVPITVTFCPLCNSAIVFDGRVQGRELSFGVSGMLRHSDMIMYDRPTQSWWQQFTGEAVIGQMMGTELTVLASWMQSVAQFRAEHPDGLIMDEPTGHARAYGQNPYRRYDSAAQPFLYQGSLPPHGIAPLARVLRVGDHAWPLERLRKAGDLVENGLRITWAAGVASALDEAQISGSRDVGAIRVYDADTGAPVAHEVVFAFAFHAFAPEGHWHLGAAAR